MYQEYNGDKAALIAFIEAAMNEVITLYANEGVKMTIKEIMVHTSNDGYPSGSYNKLMDFKGRRSNNFNGDLAHLISFEGGGGIAYVGVLCWKNYAFGYSGLSTKFSVAPTYSWTVEVLTHEIGHNLGSPHTHACAWGPKGNEAIDCCAPYKNSAYDECTNGC